MPSSVVFGGGFAGLTAAHELVKAGHTVVLYEKLDEIGGMARSKRVSNNVPTEHSWRGIGPFYANFRQIIQEIPTRTGTVYDELSKLATFLQVKDNEIDPNYIVAKHVTLKDRMITGLKIGKVIITGSHLFATESVYDYFYPKLSPAGQDYLKTLGPWLGLDLYSASMLDLSKLIEFGLVSHAHMHKDKNGKEWEHNINQRWHVMNKPTSEAVFEPWRAHLESLGVVIVINSKLTDVRVGQDNLVESCVVDYDQVITADNYVVAINPFEFAVIVNQNPTLHNDPGMRKCETVIQDGPNEMISFQIALGEKINIVPDDIVFTFPDSEFNITLYFQEHFFDKNVDLGNGVQSLVSGTACLCSDPGALFGLPAKRCSKAQFISEIHHQISRCQQFQAYIALHNGARSFSTFPIMQTEIWDEWDFGEPGDLAQNQSTKWVSSVTNNLHRPSQTTTFRNLFIAGAHTKTSTNIWSMEGAVESGKLAAIAAGARDVFLYTHECPLWIKILGKLLVFGLVFLVLFSVYWVISLLLRR